MGFTAGGLMRDRTDGRQESAGGYRTVRESLYTAFRRGS
jgi:hypothetical protein